MVSWKWIQTVESYLLFPFFKKTWKIELTGPKRTNNSSFYNIDFITVFRAILTNLISVVSSLYPKGQAKWSEITDLFVWESDGK